MKYLSLLLLFFITTLQAQTNLQFDKRFVESENKWVAFQKGKDSTYVYGFIYIDAAAGLTFNYEGKFTISAEGTFTPKKIDSANLKVRLQPNTVLVAFIPENKYEELKITAIPDWLKYYKTDTASIERLYRWGFLYNGWSECAKGLTYLEKAQKLNPKFKGLEVELAFSYNCLGQYDKAILVLTGAIETNPTDAYFYKELIYAEVKSDNLDKAAETCKKAIAICKSTAYNGENCYNLLHSFYEKKDKKNFDIWLPEAKKWASSNADILRNITIMEKGMGAEAKKI